MPVTAIAHDSRPQNFGAQDFGRHGLDEPYTPKAQRYETAPDRLPPGLALPAIALMSIGGWYVVWQIGAVVTSLFG